MSEETNVSQGSPGAPASPILPPPRPASRGSGLALLLAALAVAASAVLCWQWFELRGRVESLRQVLAEGDTAAKEARGAARQGQESLAALQAKVGAIESRLAESESQAAALEALYQEFSRSRDDRALAEVEQAVIVANQQLQLAGNVEAALVALQGAETHLALVEQTRVQPLRRALASDIEHLRSLPTLDVAGLAFKLDALQGIVDGLPLAFAGEAQPTPPGEASAAQGPSNFFADLGRELWREVQGLVRVERLDRPEPALVGPAQGVYLRENLKIRLLSARLGLLSRDGRAFSEDLRQAAAWVERYFDVREAPVKNALKDLKELAAVKISDERPAINDSLAALRALQNRVPAAPHEGVKRPAAH